MDRLYEIALEKRAQLTKILENEPYAPDSFARVGYRIRDGATLEEDKTKIYLFISSSEEFVKKADDRLKDVAVVVEGEKASRIISKIKAEEEAAESGFGSIFG
ncbi:MAG: hypothetical protein QW153_02285 [Candidatus Bilamarchaeaceae archaeon]